MTDIQYHNIASRWTPDYHCKADRIHSTASCSLDEMLQVALENAISCEVARQIDRQLYWLRCAMLAQEEISRRKMACQ